MVHRNYRKATAVLLASLLLICTLALAACGGTSDSTSNTANSTQPTTTSSTTSAPTTDSPTASAEKIKNIDQQVQDASTTLDSTKKDADNAGQQNSENDQNP